MAVRLQSPPPPYIENENEDDSCFSEEGDDNVDQIQATRCNQAMKIERHSFANFRAGFKSLFRRGRLCDLRTLAIREENALELAHQGHLEEAQQLFEAILKSRLGQDGSDSRVRLLPETHKQQVALAGTYFNLAGILTCQDLRQKAISYYWKAYSIRRKSLGYRHYDALDTLSSLAMVYTFDGEYEQAEKLLSDVESCCRHSSGSELLNALLWKSGHARAILYDLLGKTDQAEAKLLSVLREMKATCQPTHLEALIAMSNLGTYYCRHHDLDEAQSFYARALYGDSVEGSLSPSLTAFRLDRVTQLEREHSVI